METGERWALGHRPALDGVRGIAILLVLIAHAGDVYGDTLAPLGTLGVGLFFVLSGFLISSLLLDEHAKSGHVSLSAFYWRRAGRLFPALAAMLLFMVAIDSVTLRELVSTVFYISNWVQAGTGEVGDISFVWSLAIEEQFYIVWPLVLLAAMKWRGRSAVAAAAAVGAATSIVVRATAYGIGASDLQVSRWTFTNADGLLVGCLLAALMAWLPSRASRPVAAVALAGLLAIAACLTPAWPVLVPALASLGGGIVVWWSARGRASGILGWRPLTLVGKRSYALYLWHVPMMDVFLWSHAPRWLIVAGGLTSAWLVTLGSWRWVESPCQNWVRARLRRRAEAAPEPREEDVSTASS